MKKAPDYDIFQKWYTLGRKMNDVFGLYFSTSYSQNRL